MGFVLDFVLLVGALLLLANICKFYSLLTVPKLGMGYAGKIDKISRTYVSHQSLSRQHKINLLLGVNDKTFCESKLSTHCPNRRAASVFKLHTGDCNESSNFHSLKHRRGKRGSAKQYIGSETNIKGNREDRPWLQIAKRTIRGCKKDPGLLDTLVNSLVKFLPV
jgi:hypothetical protein